MPRRCADDESDTSGSSDRHDTYPASWAVYVIIVHVGRLIQSGFPDVCQRFTYLGTRGRIYWCNDSYLSLCSFAVCVYSGELLVQWWYLDT